MINAAYTGPLKVNVPRTQNSRKKKKTTTLILIFKEAIPSRIWEHGEKMLQCVPPWLLLQAPALLASLNNIP